MALLKGRNAEALAVAVSTKRAAIERERAQIRRWNEEVTAATKAVSENRVALSKKIESTKALQAKLAQLEKDRDSVQGRSLRASGEDKEGISQLMRELENARKELSDAKQLAVDARKSASSTLADIRAAKARAIAAGKKKRESIARNRAKAEGIDKTTRELKASLVQLIAKAEAQAGGKVAELRKEESRYLDEKSALDVKAASALEEQRTSMFRLNTTLKKAQDASKRHAEASEKLENEIRAVRKLLVSFVATDRVYGGR